MNTHQGYYSSVFSCESMSHIVILPVFLFSGFFFFLWLVFFFCEACEKYGWASSRTLMKKNQGLLCTAVLCLVKLHFSPYRWCLSFLSIFGNFISAGVISMDSRYTLLYLGFLIFSTAYWLRLLRDRVLSVQWTLNASAFLQ